MLPFDVQTIPSAINKKKGKLIMSTKQLKTISKALFKKLCRMGYCFALKGSFTKTSLGLNIISNLKNYYLLEA